MRVIIFGGTTEGREAIPALQEMGYEVSVSVATETGLEALRGCKAKVLVGRKEVKELKQLLLDYEVCIDATHPYAEKITENLRNACEFAGTRYFRLIREETKKLPPSTTDQPEGNETGKTDGFCLIRVNSAKEAADLIENRIEGRVLLTTGSKELPDFEGVKRDRLFARVLPTGESIRACEENGIPHRNIIALWGPFQKELNLALLRQYRIRCLVTKESGKEGGFDAKIKAAEEGGCTVIVIERPKESGMSFSGILSELSQPERRRRTDNTRRGN